ncbi:MAG: L-seryl-tRNA(Sec) selenium transferase [Actinobacteria bacterium]|nr:L-seryl-tRNA(Sec) selenium transferase [Actinomycetota bacterium]
MDRSQQLRALPGIDRLLARCADLIAAHGRATVTDALRAAVDDARTAVLDGAPVPTPDDVIAAAAAHIDRRRPPRLQPVINATGVIVHTNLGRAPLADAARAAVLDATGYCDLEYDLASGRRGSRVGRLEPLLCDATGAPAALAVNNAAAALVLALAALAGGREVIVSRGELIEIGGSFRLPDIMGASGARLIEVGTTNRTRAGDYVAGDDPGAILTLHPSNYRIVGFVAQPTLTELAGIAARRGVPLIFDAGSGLLRPAGGALADEPAVSTALDDGADIVLCSGDKLLGGPQAGLLFGRRALIERCRRHPLARALRLDKLRIAALQATLELHLRDARHEVPVWAMLSADREALGRRVDRLVAMLTERGVPAEVVTVDGVPGGGAAPDATLPGPAARIVTDHPDALATRLRSERPPIVVRVADGTLVVDLRTVESSEDEEIVARLAAGHQDRHPDTQP